MRRSLARIGVVTILIAAPAAAGPDSGDGAQHIKNLAGCFEVAYLFAEDGKRDSLASGKALTVREWVALRTKEDRSVILLHVSITPDGSAVPHWYEAWRPGQAAGTWTQQVWSDTPGHPESELRYQCTAPWTMNRWQCHAGRSPKPFRDSGAPFGFDRQDYAWLDRENILLVTESGWIQNEHNRKVDSAGETVAHELGWITYQRIADDACRVAIDRFPAEPDKR